MFCSQLLWGGAGSSEGAAAPMVSTEPCLTLLLLPTNPEQEQQFYTSSCIHTWLWARRAGAGGLIQMLPSSRRFHHSLTDNNRWIRERSHESYAKNYSVVFPHDEPLAGRNVRKDPLHEVRNRLGWPSQQQKGAHKEWVQLCRSPKPLCSHPSILGRSLPGPTARCEGSG